MLHSALSLSCPIQFCKTLTDFAGAWCLLHFWWVFILHITSRALFANDTIITKECANEQTNERNTLSLDFHSAFCCCHIFITVALQNFRTCNLFLSIFTTSTTWRYGCLFLISHQTHKYAIDARLFIIRFWHIDLSVIILIFLKHVNTYRAFKNIFVHFIFWFF